MGSPLCLSYVRKQWLHERAATAEAVGEGPGFPGEVLERILDFAVGGQR